MFSKIKRKLGFLKIDDEGYQRQKMDRQHSIAERNAMVERKRVHAEKLRNIEEDNLRRGRAKWAEEQRQKDYEKAARRGSWRAKPIKEKARITGQKIKEGIVHAGQVAHKAGKVARKLGVNENLAYQMAGGAGALRKAYNKAAYGNSVPKKTKRKHVGMKPIHFIMGEPAKKLPVNKLYKTHTAPKQTKKSNSNLLGSEDSWG